ncbi:hypothetical protein QUF70_14165, partial [Desulfobacterales bacterium HSG17]|nr:hypothetical protein [Desulfobacterales bacterium HSG17]
LIILELICKGKDYTSKIILQFVQWMKKFGTNRLLTLHAFVDLKGVLPGHLLQFFMANFPKHTQKEIGEEAYLEELSELTMNLKQIDIFYNICSQISGITPKIALSILPKIRQLKPQQAQIINTFLNENVSFGEKPVKGDNITGLINLWLSLPDMTDKANFHKLFKKLSKKPAKKKNDFQFLIQSFKNEIENEKGNEKSSGNITSTIRNFFK